MISRAATPNDAEALARIYNEGIDDRIATFETRSRTAETGPAQGQGGRATSGYPVSRRAMAHTLIAVSTA